MSTRYYEDLDEGESHAAGSATVTERDIVDFAEAYDPQPMHVDPEAAEASSFGGLIASGWHTASVAMRLLVDGLLDDVAVVGAIGVDDLRWRSPVRPGDELSVVVTVAATESWDESKGLVTFDVAVGRADGDTVMTRSDLVLVARRPD